MISKRRLYHRGLTRGFKKTENISSNNQFIRHRPFYFCILYLVLFLTTLETSECFSNGSVFVKEIANTPTVNVSSTSQLSQMDISGNSSVAATGNSANPSHSAMLQNLPSTNLPTAILLIPFKTDKQAGIYLNPYSLHKFSFTRNENGRHEHREHSSLPKNDFNFLESIIEPGPYIKMLEPDNSYQEKEINSNKTKPDVSVTIYHHQGIHSPIADYGMGKPWNSYGTGYGLHYDYDLDGKYSRQKGAN